MSSDPATTSTTSTSEQQQLKQKEPQIPDKQDETQSSAQSATPVGTTSQKITLGITQGFSQITSKVKGITKQAVSAGGKMISRRQSGGDIVDDEHDYKYEKKAWIPKKQIVYNEGTIKRRVKRVLVTGGAGFIGSHLVDTLMMKGYDVICLDNLFSGSKDNIWKWFGNPNFEFIRHDVTQPFFAEIDEIYHLACPASPVFYQNNPIKTLKTNFVGTYNMLGLAKRVNARILLTSTSEVYGDPKIHPQKEDYWGHVNPIGIRSCYDEGKRVAETLMFEYNRMHGVNIAVARIFNTYGPRMLENDGRVVSNFIVQALRGESLTIYGDGTQTRSFCYIDDQINGLIKLMESNQTGPINIGNPDEYTIKQLGDNIVQLVNKKVPNREPVGFVKRPLPSDDPKKRKPDITLAKKYLQWEPKYPLQEGLSHTIDYFIEFLESNQENDHVSSVNAKVNTTDNIEDDNNQTTALENNGNEETSQNE